MAAFKRAKRYLSAARRNLGARVERYGKGAVVGGVTMVVLVYVIGLIGPLVGGVAAVVFGRTDNYGSTQTVWAGVTGAILFTLHGTARRILSGASTDGSVDAVTVATDILLVLVTIPAMTLNLLLFGLVGGYIGHEVRKHTVGDGPGRPT